MNDAFPMFVHDEAEEWQHLEPFLQDMKDFLRTFQESACTYKGFIRENSCKLYWRDCKNRSYNHVKNSFKEATMDPPKTVTALKHWDWIYKHLRDEKNPDLIKHGDVRLGWRYENIYLVKKYFTFGMRRTPKDLVDVYQTSNSPLFIYIPKPNFKNLMRNDRTFPVEDEYKFEVRKMEPYSIYLVPPEQTYIIIAFHKTLFALDRMPSSLVPEIMTKNYIKSIISITSVPLWEPPTVEKKKPVMPTFDPYACGPVPSVMPMKWDKKKLKRSTYPEFTMPASTLPKPEFTMPASTLPQPEFTMPASTLPQSVTAMPASTLPQPEFTTPASTLPQPVTAMPASTLPQPKTAMPASTLPQPKTAMPASTLPQPVTTMPASTLPEPVTTMPASTLPQPETTMPANTLPQPVTTMPASTLPQPETTMPASTLPEPVTAMPQPDTAMPQPETTLQCPEAPPETPQCPPPEGQDSTVSSDQPETMDIFSDIDINLPSIDFSWLTEENAYPVIPEEAFLQLLQTYQSL